MKHRDRYKVRWKPKSCGRDGGDGNVRSFVTTARSPDGAAKKLKSNGRVISVRKAGRT